MVSAHLKAGKSWGRDGGSGSSDEASGFSVECRTGLPGCGVKARGHQPPHSPAAASCTELVLSPTQRAAGQCSLAGQQPLRAPPRQLLYPHCLLSWEMAVHPKNELRVQLILRWLADAEHWLARCMGHRPAGSATPPVLVPFQRPVCNSWEQNPGFWLGDRPGDAAWH